MQPSSKIKRVMDPSFYKKVRRRDGYCLWGRHTKDGCWGPQEVHHIETRGSGGDDVAENGILLCRKHHNEAHSGKVTRSQLKQLLADVYGYAEA